jgi:hypothetical protein
MDATCTCGNEQEGFGAEIRRITDKKIVDLIAEADALIPEGFELCEDCGGFGLGPDQIQGDGDVFQEKCCGCSGKGLKPKTEERT